MTKAKQPPRAPRPRRAGPREDVELVLASLGCSEGLARPPWADLCALDATHLVLAPGPAGSPWPAGHLCRGEAAGLRLVTELSGRAIGLWRLGTPPILVEYSWEARRKTR